ncbi:DNA-3-methyladenine glycosylase I [Fictibacillus gelatini]|uniref:DNA-3-methyladenine glycosylase I n=1 Tax=Fictibacillus gelatini TaxID=225985 RepID=UPI0003FEFD44|nr:DNA-3-methyladenine glycosylase I [Fictibacillus gelatini]
MNEIKRCRWGEEDDLLRSYHDEEWGRGVTDDDQLFEFLTLEIFQAGLSWRTILHKRENFREAFSQFHIKTVMQYGKEKVEELMQNAGIIRNRRKIEATIENAQRCHQLIREYGSLFSFFQQLPEGKEDKQKAMKATFKHVGLTTAESFLMATGLIPATHEEGCFLERKTRT